MSSTTLARAVSSRGELVLRRREWDGELELRVNGVFVMDSHETTTERALAVLALDCITRRRDDLKHADADAATDADTDTDTDTDGEPAPLTVLVGGLGLGYTLEQFASSALVGTVVVAEIEPDLVAWHRSGLVPLTVRLVNDPRISLLAADIQDVVRAQPPGSLDVIVLDVDNGPGYLVYDANAAVYEDAFLSMCREALADKGVLVVWSADRAPELATTLELAFGSVSHHAMAVRRSDRLDRYHVYVAPAHPDEGEDQDEAADEGEDQGGATDEGEPCPAP